MGYRLALLGFSLAALALADDIPLAPGDLRIPPGETWRVDFGTVPQAGTTVTLRLLARMDFPTLSGSNLFLRIRLNGRPVGASKSRQALRLSNRSLVSPVAPDLPATWCTDGHWRLVYAPDFEGATKQSYYVGNPYEFVLDVTDLTNPAAENRLELVSTAGDDRSLFTKGGGDIVIRELTVRTEPVPSPTMAAAAGADAVLNRGEPGAGPAPYAGRVLPGGGFVLEAGGSAWAFDSAFSYPDAGLNLLVPEAAPDTGGEARWRVEVTAAVDGGRVTAGGAHYRVDRQVRFGPRQVSIADTITNAHGDVPLGLLVRHDLDLAPHADVRVRLAGNPDPALNDEYAPANPSVHVAAGTAFGLGLLCEDTPFRNQARLYVDPKPFRAGLRTEMLWLPPGGSHTLEWSVYPVASGDYYDFANLVRQDWSANITTEGPWTFFSPDTVLATPVATLAEQFRRLGIRYACYCGGWVDPKQDRKRIGFGTGVMDPYWADFRGRLKAAGKRLRQACPGVKVLVYYDTQRDTSEGGRERFRDSWLTDVQGNPLSTEWSGAYSLTYSVVATLDNTYGKAMLEVADRYLDEMGVDGLYWDEMEGTGYGAPLITYNRHDGYSCILDPKTYRIERLAGVTTLLGESHRLAVIDRVRARGGTLMGNGPPCTRDLLGRQVQRMVEIQHNDSWCYQGNLSTPLGYASWRPDFGNWVRALDLATLLVGTRYDYAHEISPLAFPFTPIELHQGYLLGWERILTTHDGSYGWFREAPLVLAHHLDQDGKRQAAAWTTTYRQGECRTAVRLTAGQAAVLERLPWTVEGDGEAEFRDVAVRQDALLGTVGGHGRIALRRGDRAAQSLELTPEPRAFEIRLP